VLTAITRDVNPDMGDGELTFVSRTSIDFGLAERQHQQYQAALSALGCDFVTIPTRTGLADSVFIEDTAIVLDEIAVLCRPGAESRRPEVTAVETVLKQYRPIASIEAPGTLDGGDLLRVGKTIFAGHSTRSNLNGIGQLQKIVADYGYSVKIVETSRCLHLKSAVSQVSPDLLLINPAWIDGSAFEGFELLEVDQRETHAANALLAGEKLIYPAAFPYTLKNLKAHGIDVIAVDVSELQKAEGAVTCCSLILEV